MHYAELNSKVFSFLVDGRYGWCCICDCISVSFDNHNVPSDAKHHLLQGVCQNICNWARCIYQRDYHRGMIHNVSLITSHETK